MTSRCRRLDRFRHSRAHPPRTEQRCPAPRARGLARARTAARGWRPPHATVRPSAALSRAGTAAPDEGQRAEREHPGGAVRRGPGLERAGPLLGVSRVGVGGRHARTTWPRIGHRGYRDGERERGGFSQHTRRFRRAPRLRGAVVPESVTAVRARRRATAAARHVVPIALDQGARFALAGRGRARAVTAAEWGGGGAAAVLDARTALLRSEAAAGVVTRRVFARARLRRCGRGPEEQDDEAEVPKSRHFPAVQ